MYYKKVIKHVYSWYYNAFLKTRLLTTMLIVNIRLQRHFHINKSILFK